MNGDDYRALAATQQRLMDAKANFSKDEFAQLQKAVEALDRYELSTLLDIAPSATGDGAWAPISDFVGDDASPDDMTAVSAAANHLEKLGLIESETPSADDGARIDLMRYRATDLGRRFASAVRGA